jgi:hypothetical protein
MMGSSDKPQDELFYAFNLDDADVTYSWSKKREMVGV